MKQATKRKRQSRRTGSAPTISDVARLAGVSDMTVSRVINGAANVQPPLREAVARAIDTLNYVPNPAARSLAGARQKKLGLLYGNPSAGFLSELLIGSLDQTSRIDAQVIIKNCVPGERELSVVEHLIASGVHGVILPPPLCENVAVLQLLAAANLPVVTVANARPSHETMTVGIDDRAAARMMTRHLIALGHRRIGFVQGDPALSASALRREGYCAALDEAGIAIHEELLVPGLYTYQSGLDAAEALLALVEPPTAIFASNDDMAAAAVAVAHRCSMSVPGDLTVCGFDDTTLAVTIWPELTTIRQPICEMAREAVNLLAAAIQDGRLPDEPDRHRIVGFDLIRRQSDAAPRRRPR